MIRRASPPYSQKSENSAINTASKAGPETNSDKCRPSRFPITDGSLPLFRGGNWSELYSEFVREFEAWGPGKSSGEIAEFVRQNELLMQYDLFGRQLLYETIGKHFRAAGSMSDAMKWYELAETQTLHIRARVLRDHQRVLNHLGNIHVYLHDQPRALECYWECLTLDRKPLLHFSIEPRCQSWSEEFFMEPYNAARNWGNAAMKKENWNYQRVPAKAFSDALKRGRDEEVKNCLPVDPDLTAITDQAIRTLENSSRSNGLKPGEADVLVQAAKILQELEQRAAIGSRDRAIAVSVQTRTEIKASQPKDIRSRESMGDYLERLAPTTRSLSQ